MPRRVPYEEVKRFFEEERGFELIDTQYINNSTPMKYKCVCGAVSKMSYANARKGKNCRECGFKKMAEINQIYTTEYIKDYFTSKGCILLEVEYKADPHYRMKYKCECGEESRISWSSFLGGSRCKDCGIKKRAASRRKYTIEELKQTFAEQGKVLLEEVYMNNGQPLKYVCKCGKEASITLGNFLSGKDCFDCGVKKTAKARRDPNITDEQRLENRSVPETRIWRTAVYERDDYTCQRCEHRGGELNAHHICNYADYAELRFEVGNGIVLCKKCHVEFHREYGVKFTNREQIVEFIGVFKATS